MSLQIIYNFIVSNYKNISKNIKLINVIENHSQSYNKLNDIFFISNKIKNEIKKLLFSKTLTYQFKSNKITITIYDYNNNNDSKNLLLVKKIATVFFIFANLKDDNPKHLKISLYLTKNEKKLNYQKDSIGVDEVNSGCSIFENIDGIGEIFIWRKEEIFKVFIHELIHSLGFDFKDYPKNLKTQLKNQLNIKNDIEIKLFETYVETWACILNVVFKSYFNNQINVNNNFQKEIQFSMEQVAKILNFYDYKCFLNCSIPLLKSKIKNKTKNNEFKQDTSVLSYYILKSALLYNFNRFIQFCTFHNHKLFIFQKKNLQKFNELVINLLKNKNYSNKINFLLKEYKSNKKNVTNTLKMTIN